MRLLDRSPPRVALTRAGSRLLTEARAALAGVDRVRDVAETLAQGHTTNVVRIGTAPGLGQWLAKGFAAMRALAPDLELVLVEGGARSHAAAVASGALDAALVRGELPDVEATVHHVGTDAVSVVLPAIHPAAALESVPVSALANLRLRLPARTSDPVLYDAVLRRCRSEGIDVRRGRDIDSLDDAVLEIGASSTAWTAVHREGWVPPPCSAEIRPFDPPLCIPVQVLLPPNGPEACEQGLVEAFR